MSDSTNLPQLYRDLADGYAGRDQPQFRDRFLVLAADAALAAGDAATAERCRQRLLAVNPHHLLKPYSSFAQAMDVGDVQTYVFDLRQNYPPDVARGLLQSLQEVTAADRQIPVTAPLINFGSEPDLLMDDSEPLNILSLRDDAPSGVPPTLPPEKFNRAAREAAEDRSLPATLYNAAPAPDLPPPPPRPKPVPRPRGNPPPLAVVPPARPPARPASPPRPVRQPVAAPSPPRTPEPDPEPELEGTGAWFSLFLFVVSLAGCLALAGYAFVYPMVVRP